MSETVQAVVDVHEPGTLAKRVGRHEDVERWAIAGLDSADLVVGGVGFERKTPADFVASLTDGRLMGQAEKLTDAFDHAYILVEGRLTDFETLAYSAVPGTSVRGMMASLSARHGIHTYLCDTQALLVDMAVRLGRKHTEDPSRVHIPAPDVEADPVLKMYACLPGVGAERATTLRDAYPAPDALVTAGVDDIAALDGFGETTAQAVYDTLRGEEA